MSKQETDIEDEMEEEIDEYEEYDDRRHRKNCGVGIIVLRIFLILAIVVVIAILAIVIVFHHYYGKLQYDDGKQTYATTEYEEEDADPTASDSDAEAIETVKDQVMQNLEDKSTPVKFSDDVYNILLIGNDSRDKNTLGRSDSMILVSINEQTKQIVMTSIMRDSYVYIPNVGTTRINAAYAYGGPELLMETVESNFKINIDKYVGVNFFSFMKVVDSVGGVEITVSDAEVNVLNNYIRELNKLEGLPEDTDKLTGGGTYVMNGKQALGYSRIRYVGNADYQRTERQRTVLNEIFTKVKDCNLKELQNVLDSVLPEVTTDIKEGEMFTLMLDFARKYKDYDIVQCRVPADGTITDLVINGAMVLGIDLPANIEYMHKSIYGE